MSTYKDSDTETILEFQKNYKENLVSYRVLKQNEEPSSNTENKNQPGYDPELNINIEKNSSSSTEPASNSNDYYNEYKELNDSRVKQVNQTQGNSNINNYSQIESDDNQTISSSVISYANINGMSENEMDSFISNKQRKMRKQKKFKDVQMREDMWIMKLIFLMTLLVYGIVFYSIYLKR